MPQKYINVKQASDYLTLAQSTIYTYVHYKKMPFVKIGERIVFEKTKLDRWVSSKGGKKK
jgi:excisionase family DNA binding protein